MAKMRDRIRMSDAEVWAFLDECRNLQVATLRRDGSPHLTTLWFATLDGAIAFPSYTKAQKIVNLRRDPRIAVLAEQGNTYETLRGVSINATADLLEDDPRHADYSYALTKRYARPEQSEAEIREESRRMMVKHTMVLLRPERVISWDHRKLTTA